MAFNWGEITAAAVFLILLGVLLNYIFAKYRARRERRVARHNESVSEFRSAFSDALLNISLAEHTIALILRQTFRDHEVAYHKFREHVPDRKKDQFDEAWSQYESYYQANAKDALHYQFASAKTDFEEEQRKQVAALIKNILDFAKEA